MAMKVIIITVIALVIRVWVCWMIGDTFLPHIEYIDRDDYY